MDCGHGWRHETDCDICRPPAVVVAGLRGRISELEAALRNVMIGGNHCALLIGADHPPYQWEPDEARAHYGKRQDAYEAWCCWRAIMHARDVLECN